MRHQGGQVIGFCALVALLAWGGLIWLICQDPLWRQK